MALDTVEDFAVVAFVEEQAWQVGVLPERLTGDLDGLVAALRQQPGDSGATRAGQRRGRVLRGDAGGRQTTYGCCCPT